MSSSRRISPRIKHGTKSKPLPQRTQRNTEEKSSDRAGAPIRQAQSRLCAPQVLMRALAALGIHLASHRPGLPLFDHSLIVRLPVREVGPEGEQGINHHAQVGLVLEADAEAVIVGVGDQLNQLYRPAFCLGKLHHLPIGGLSLFGRTWFLWQFAAGLLLHGLSLSRFSVCRFSVYQRDCSIGGTFRTTPPRNEPTKTFAQ